MSTSYICDPDYPEIEFDDLRNLTIQENKVKAFDSSESDEYSLCLTDGQNYLWVYGSPGGIAHSFTRFGGNDVEDIIHALEFEFDCSIISEDDDRYQELLELESELEDEDEDEDDEVDVEDTSLAKEYHARTEEE